ncbi:MAG: acetylglutamate kinase [Candidatus Methylacidiphilales bacterium]|nr:acetylglutamate kinase [Candidatus Methylacidiphilales bacterium]
MNLVQPSRSSLHDSEHFARSSMNKDQIKAEALIEALPYIQRFRGQTMVIKYGGAAMDNEEIVERVLRDIVFLEAVGINPVLVHGGGKAITRAMKERGVSAQFIDGLRVTDLASIDLINQTLSNEINPSIVQNIRAAGGKAQGFNGKDILKAKKMRYFQAKTSQEVDLGFVGDITGVNTAPLLDSIAREEMPVISPLGCDEEGNIYNINADVAAGEIAQALGAFKIIYLSDVNGVMRDPRQVDSTISHLTITQINKLKREGIIDGGMIPKVDSAIEALESGVKKVHFLDGRIPHSLLLEIFTDAGIGTEITKD